MKKTKIREKIVRKGTQAQKNVYLLQEKGPKFSGKRNNTRSITNKWFDKLTDRTLTNPLLLQKSWQAALTDPNSSENDFTQSKSKVWRKKCAHHKVTDRFLRLTEAPLDPCGPGRPCSPSRPLFPGKPCSPLSPVSPTYPKAPPVPGRPRMPFEPNFPGVPGDPKRPVVPWD